ncbi:MAG: YkgJ family cysteine cluster protein [Desulfurococcaceae archaeon]
MCGSCCRMSPISVLPHEVIVLEELAENLGVEVRFVHGYVVYEAVNDVNLAFSYVMQLISDKCPFLRENKCSIHYIYKPYICRSFPYIPRHVKYSIDDVNRYIMASADYGLSLACHVVKKDREVLEKHAYSPNILTHYLKGERAAAIEAENARAILLLALSKLWRDGLVDIKTSKPGALAINLYEFLRRFYPDLPSVLGMDKVAVRMRKWFKAY